MSKSSNIFHRKEVKYAAAYSSDKWSNHKQVPGCVPYENRMLSTSELKMKLIKISFGRFTDHCLSSPGNSDKK